MSMKAYDVRSAIDRDGSIPLIVVFAQKATKAKSTAYRKARWYGCKYTDLRAKRVPNFDSLAGQDLQDLHFYERGYAVPCWKCYELVHPDGSYATIDDNPAVWTFDGMVYHMRCREEATR